MVVLLLLLLLLLLLVLLVVVARVVGDGFSGWSGWGEVQSSSELELTVVVATAGVGGGFCIGHVCNRPD